MKLQTFFNKQKKPRNYIFSIYPILKFRIKENSMSPFLKPDTLVLVNRLSYLFKKPKVEEVIVIKNPDKKNRKIKYLVKRIKKIEENKYFVQGDNLKESIDSRNFGFISKNDILGKVVSRF